MVYWLHDEIVTDPSRSVFRLGVPRQACIFRLCSLLVVIKQQIITLRLQGLSVGGILRLLSD